MIIAADLIRKARGVPRLTRHVMLESFVIRILNRLWAVHPPGSRIAAIQNEEGESCSAIIRGSAHGLGQRVMFFDSTLLGNPSW
jgi:hypothetical protein